MNQLQAATESFALIPWALAAGVAAVVAYVVAGPLAAGGAAIAIGSLATAVHARRAGFDRACSAYDRFYRPASATRAAELE